MKKVFRYLLIIIGIFVLLAAGFAAFIAIRGIPHYKAEKINIAVESSPERIARGKKLASMLCFHCHFDQGTGKLTGRKMDEAPQFGEIYSRNITRSSGYGIGKWTDGELIYLLRTGVRPDGRYIPPYMAKLPNMADEDIYSIIAFLKSDDPWVQPDNTRHPDSKPSFLTKFISNIGAAKPFPYPKEKIPLPDTSNAVTWGRYLVVNLECFSCHSKDFSTNNYMEPEKSPGFCGGGNTMILPGNNKIQTLNITPDEETGIGKWTGDDFIKALKSGIVPGNQPALRPPMMPYANLTDAEAKAMYEYLQTIPKIKNKVNRNL